MTVWLWHIDFSTKLSFHGVFVDCVSYKMLLSIYLLIFSSRNIFTLFFFSNVENFYLTFSFQLLLSQFYFFFNFSTCKMNSKYQRIYLTFSKAVKLLEEKQRWTKKKRRKRWKLFAKLEWFISQFFFHSFVRSSVFEERMDILNEPIFTSKTACITWMRKAEGEKCIFYQRQERKNEIQWPKCFSLGIMMVKFNLTGYFFFSCLQRRWCQTRPQRQQNTVYCRRREINFKWLCQLKTKRPTK